MGRFVSAEQVESSLGVMLADHGVLVGTGACIVLSQVGIVASPSQLHIAFCPGIILAVEEQWDIKPQLWWRRFPDRLMVKDASAHRFVFPLQNGAPWTGFVQLRANLEVHRNAVNMTAMEPHLTLPAVDYNQIRFCYSFETIFGDRSMAEIARDLATAS